MVLGRAYFLSSFAFVLDVGPFPCLSLDPGVGTALDFMLGNLAPTWMKDPQQHVMAVVASCKCGHHLWELVNLGVLWKESPFHRSSCSSIAVISSWRMVYWYWVVLAEWGQWWLVGLGINKIWSNGAHSCSHWLWGEAKKIMLKIPCKDWVESKIIS